MKHITPLLALLLLAACADAGKTKPAAEIMATSESESLLKDARAKIAAGQSAEALPLLDKALSQSPDNPKILHAKAVAQDAIGDHAGAQTIYRKLLESAPESVALQNNLALSLLLGGNASAAIGILEPLANSKNATPTIRQNLALAHGVQGNQQRALALGLKDLPAEQANANLQFFDYLRSKQTTNRFAVNAPLQPEKGIAEAAPVMPVKLAPLTAPAPLIAEKPPAPAAPQPTISAAAAPEPAAANNEIIITEDTFATESEESAGLAAKAPEDAAALTPAAGQ